MKNFVKFVDSVEENGLLGTVRRGVGMYKYDRIDAKKPARGELLVRCVGGADEGIGHAVSAY